jgi:hypothetical protein
MPPSHANGAVNVYMELMGIEKRSAPQSLNKQRAGTPPNQLTKEKKAKSKS